MVKAALCKAGVRKVESFVDSRSSRDRVRQDQGEHRELVHPSVEVVPATSAEAHIPPVLLAVVSRHGREWLRHCRLQECPESLQDVPALLRVGLDSAISKAPKKGR